MNYTIKEFNDAQACFAYQKLKATLFRTAGKGLNDESEYISNFDASVPPGFFRLGAFDEERLCAAASFLRYTVNLDGQKLTMYGVGGVVSDFNQPRKGAMKEIFAKAFERMKEKGVLLSHLYPFEQNYYRQYGYEVSCASAVWEIPVSAFKASADIKFIAFDDSDKMKQEIMDIYAVFANKRNMSVVRDEAYWDRFFQENKAYTSGAKIFVSYVDGVADGVMRYTLKEHENKPFDFVVNNLYFKSFAGLRGLLSYFHTQRAYADKVYIHLPVDVDLSPMIDSCTGYGKRHASAKISDAGLSKVVDVEGILKAAQYQGTGTVAIKITNDTYCPWNNDCFTVCFGETTTVERGGNPDIEMDIRAFSSSILGRTPYECLDSFPDVKIYGNEENLKKVFYKKRCWIEEHF